MVDSTNGIETLNPRILTVESIRPRHSSSPLLVTQPHESVRIEGDLFRGQRAWSNEIGRAALGKSMCDLRSDWIMIYHDLNPWNRGARMENSRQDPAAVAGPVHLDGRGSADRNGRETLGRLDRVVKVLHRQHYSRAERLCQLRSDSGCASTAGTCRPRHQRWVGSGESRKQARHRGLCAHSECRRISRRPSRGGPPPAARPAGTPSRSPTSWDAQRESA